MEDTWVKEAFMDKSRWEWKNRMDPSCHFPAVLDHCMKTGISYSYAGQVWKVGSGEQSFTLMPILH